MDTQRLFAELDLSPKPWLQRAMDADHLSQTLEGRHAREHWKYTPIGAFVDAYVAHCGHAMAAERLDIDGDTQAGVSILPLTALTGQDLEFARTSLAALDVGRYPLAELTALNTKAGYLIKIAHSLSDPIHIRHRGAEQLLLIDVADQATVSIIETSEQQDFGNTITVLKLGAGAQVDHARSALHAAPMHLSLLSAVLGEGANYTMQQYLVGGQKRRSDCHIALAAPHARATISGAFVTEDGHHLDQQLVVEHQAPSTTSKQTIHGIGMGKSRSIFNGRIHIFPGANGADAELRNKNLSLNPGADIYTKPELEIYTDDVKCAHGATVGQLDPEQLFYLRSRGIAEPGAKTLLCSAFVRSCIHGRLAGPATRRLTECLT